MALIVIFENLLSANRLAHKSTYQVSAKASVCLLVTELKLQRN